MLLTLTPNLAFIFISNCTVNLFLSEKKNRIKPDSPSKSQSTQPVKKTFPGGDKGYENLNSKEIDFGLILNNKNIQTRLFF